MGEKSLAPCLHTTAREQRNSSRHVSGCVRRRPPSLRLPRVTTVPPPCPAACRLCAPSVRAPSGHPVGTPLSGCHNR